MPSASHSTNKASAAKGSRRAKAAPAVPDAGALTDALADLPPRVRVHDLARRAGLNSKETIAALSAAGIDVGSASSAVDREVA
jgi:ribonuclease E